MRYAGRIADWNDERGFGFVEPNGGGERAFVHIKAFEHGARRPENGDLVSYATTTDARGRRNAVAVRFAGRRAPAPQARSRMASLRVPLALAALLTVAGGAWLALLPPFVAPACAAMSVAAFMAYGIDKSAARNGRWRIPENTLHLLALLGGWPGALLAQQWLRHKSSKPAFQAAFWITVVVNVVGLALWLGSGQSVPGR